MQPNHRSILMLTLAVFLAAPLFGPSQAAGAVKCWTNNEGVRECGNAIPPEYAQGESSTIGKQGITIDSKDRARTAEEFQAEQQRQKAAAEQAAEEKRQQEIRQKADQVLLSTFASEQDIVDGRQRKLIALEGNIEITKVSINKARQKVEGYQARIASLERAGKPVPPDLVQDMAAEQQKLENKEAFVAAKSAEVEALKLEYDGYLKRYRELTSR